MNNSQEVIDNIDKLRSENYRHFKIQFLDGVYSLFASKDAETYVFVAYLSEDIVDEVEEYLKLQD